eukprot:2057871-Pleurochrysis_carterae.AAC.1
MLLCAGNSVRAASERACVRVRVRICATRSCLSACARVHGRTCVLSETARCGAVASALAVESAGVRVSVSRCLCVLGRKRRCMASVAGRHGRLHRTTLEVHRPGEVDDAARQMTGSCTASSTKPSAERLIETGGRAILTESDAARSTQSRLLHGGVALIRLREKSASGPNEGRGGVECERTRAATVQRRQGRTALRRP